MLLRDQYFLNVDYSPYFFFYTNPQANFYYPCSIYLRALHAPYSYFPVKDNRSIYTYVMLVSNLYKLIKVLFVYFWVYWAHFKKITFFFLLFFFLRNLSFNIWLTLDNELFNFHLNNIETFYGFHSNAFNFLFFRTFRYTLRMLWITYVFLLSTEDRSTRLNQSFFPAFSPI